MLTFDREMEFNTVATKEFDEVLPTPTGTKELPPHCYGFYDWFCKSSSLKNKGKVLWSKAKSLARSKKFDPSKCYVFFKNNCPGEGRLYDDFRICDIETGEVLYTVSPKNAYGKADVWGVDNDFDQPLVEGTWREVRAWFLT